MKQQNKMPNNALPPYLLNILTLENMLDYQLLKIKYVSPFIEN